MNKDRNKAKYLIREKLKQEVQEKQGWYFIAFAKELPSNRPYGFTLFNEPFVLLKDKNNQMVCYLLSSSNLENTDVTISSFKVVEKQGEIWFWRGI